jgi:hydrogenase maturation protein HypF
MFKPGGADGLDAIRAVAHVDAIAAAQLRDPARPIVLLPRREDATSLSPLLAPGLDEIGAFLAYSPLHRLLLEDVGRPLVATSANLSGEPVLTNNQEVEQRLALIADGFLHHNRPIERPADDSVCRVIAGQPRPLRSGRGLAPQEYRLPRSVEAPTLALGGHMKNTVALAWDDRVVISPHIGDLDAPRSLQVFEQVVQDLQNLYRVHALRLVCDAHPAYASNRWARADGRPLLQVQHHHAHASALAGEYPEHERWLVFTWDGTGYGDDETIWGGETLYGGAGNWQRLASLRPFRLPGGDKAGRQPWRSALALCWEMEHDWAAPGMDTALLRRAWERHLNSPQCTAVGRLFDAAAALLGICQQASFEAQAPLQLEALARQADCEQSVALSMRQDQSGLWRSDWSALLSMLLDDRRPVAWRAACWHESLARHILEQCQWFAGERGEFTVGLSGGVFQNRLLSERVVALLEEAGMRVCLAQSVPFNDGGLSYGQIIEQLYRDTATVPA